MSWLSKLRQGTAPKTAVTTTPSGGTPTTTTVGGGGIFSGAGPSNVSMPRYNWGSVLGGSVGGLGNVGFDVTKDAANNLGSQQAAAQQATNQQNAANAATTAAAQKAQQDADAKELLRQLTARRLMMLRQQAGGQQNRNISLLRRHLAQRGALDSGSLGAGVTSIGNETSGLLAQGTNLAANQEAEGLLDLMKSARAMQFSREEADKERSNREYLMRLNQQFTKENQPEWWELLLGGIGGAIPTAAGGYFGSK